MCSHEEKPLELDETAALLLAECLRDWIARRDIASQQDSGKTPEPLQ